MRLIDLDEFLRENCISRIEGESCEGCKFKTLEVGCKRLLAQPTIDPVNLPSAKDIDVHNKDLSDYSTEIALLELEHRYGKEVRDRVEQMGFVIPKTGRWIKNQMKSKFHIEPVYICSCCREQEAWGQMELSNFCPNCGARMEGE